jgi:hypothetical protein
MYHHPNYWWGKRLMCVRHVLVMVQAAPCRHRQRRRPSAGCPLIAMPACTLRALVAYTTLLLLYPFLRRHYVLFTTNPPRWCTVAHPRRHQKLTLGCCFHHLRFIMDHRRCIPVHLRFIPDYHQRVMVGHHHHRLSYTNTCHHHQSYTNTYRHHLVFPIAAVATIIDRQCRASALMVLCRLMWWHSSWLLFHMLYGTATTCIHLCVLKTCVTIWLTFIANDLWVGGRDETFDLPCIIKERFLLRPSLFFVAIPLSWCFFF